MVRRSGPAAVAVALALSVLLAGCLGVGPVLPGGSDATPAPEGPNATVTRVVDGDTVEVRFDDGETESVRLLGVDSPEVRGDVSPDEFGLPDTAEARAWLREWADRASAFATRRLADARVRVATDPEADRRDRYGRLLAYVFRDGELFNLALLEEGYARVYDAPFGRRDEFEAAEARAQADGVGLWGFDADAVTTQTPVATDGGTGLTLVTVRADAPGNDNENPNGEYLVFRNDGDRPLSLGGWTVSDRAGHEYAFPQHASLDPGASLTLYSGTGTDGPGELYWGGTGAVWNNGGDTVTVRDANGTVVLETSYEG
ncbi:MAG: lamin tail domain-containing protein [Haloferacaceae archaeon]